MMLLPRVSLLRVLVMMQPGGMIHGGRALIRGRSLQSVLAQKLVPNPNMFILIRLVGLVAVMLSNLLGIGMSL